MWKSEALYAEGKQNHGLSRTRYRGRAKVQIQAYLNAIAQNLKRLVEAVLRWLRIWLLNRRSSTTQLAYAANTWTFSTRPVLFSKSQDRYGYFGYLRRRTRPMRAAYKRTLPTV